MSYYLQSEESKGSGTEETSSLGSLCRTTSELADARASSSRTAGSGTASGRCDAGNDASKARGGTLNGTRSCRSSGGCLASGGRSCGINGAGYGTCSRAGLAGGSRSSGRDGGRGIGDLDGNAGLLAGRLDGGDGGRLIRGAAGTLYAGLDGRKQLRALLAVAREVGERRAAVGGQGTDEAVQLEHVNGMFEVEHFAVTYGAGGDLVELSGGNGGQGDDGGDGEGLHSGGCFGMLDGINEGVVAMV